MHRRTLLRRAGLAGSLALAGCTYSTTDATDPNDGDGGDGGDGDAGSGDDETPTATPESGDGPTYVDSTFELRSRNDGRSAPWADVTFDDEAGAVVVEGTIQGSDGCKTAELGGIEYDAEADRVTVEVVTVNREGTEERACTKALVDIGYHVVAEFDGGVPESASVVHDGEGVVSAAHGSGSATPPDDG